MVPNPWLFFVAGKDSSRLRFSSKYSTLSWVFRKDRIVGVSWRWFPRPRSSSVVVRDFCSLTVRAHHCRTASSSVQGKFVSYRFSSTPAILPVLLRSIANALMLYLNSKSGVRENGKTVCWAAENEGNDQWRLSSGFHWWNFVNWQCAIFLPRRRAKPLQKNIQFFFWHFYVIFMNG